MGIVGLIFLAATISATALLFEHQIARSRPPPDLPYGVYVRVAIIALAALAFAPLIRGIRLGQIQVWLNAFFALSLLAFMFSRKALSGALIGLICLIKPQYAVLLLWGVLRREWRFMGACALIVGGGAIVALLSYGLAQNLDYLNMLSFLSERGGSYYANQSVNGLLNRIMSISDPQSYPNTKDPHFPPYTPFVYVGSMMTSC